MPEIPQSKRRALVDVAGPAAEVPAYAELHCKTNFSFLEAASHPDELANQAYALGYRALAITDRHSLAGVVRAHTAAKHLGLKLLIGAEIWPDDAPPVVLLATDRKAYGRLARLLTLGRCRSEKGTCLLHFDDLATYAEGLLACVFSVAEHAHAHAEQAGPAILPFAAHRNPKRERGRENQSSLAYASGYDGTGRESPRPLAYASGCDRRGRESQRPLTYASGCDGRSQSNRTFDLHDYRATFGDRCYLLAELHRGPHDAERLVELERMAAAARVPLVAAGDVHYHHPGRRPLQDVLTAIRSGVTVAEAGDRLFANAERHLKSPEEMRQLFAAAPAVWARTVEVAERCTFSLDELRYEYPEELCPAGLAPTQFLHELTWEGARKHYPQGVPDKVRGMLEHELELIADLRYEAYFLTVWDLVRFARGKNILCQGRGSAANSAVCYCLGVTCVDPSQMDLLFERFISRERDEAPDIDLDFEHERREEVLQYVYQKYGRERAGMTAEVITYRSRSAVRDVGKALGLSLDRVDAVAKLLDTYSRERELDERMLEAGLDPASLVGRQLLGLIDELVGFPRHLSQHVGGMVMTRGPLCELVPIENAAMADRTVIEWDKDDLDALGILKVDCLALGMLTAIHKAFDLVQAHFGRPLELATVPIEDPDVYDMICQADTMGVFQIESRAQMSMLPRLRPREYYDLVIEVAIVRPGPIQGDMVHPYLRRRCGEEPVDYPSDAVREVLHRTLGVPIFQEQAMRLAVVAAGFTPGEADKLRRAMGAWRRPGIIEQFKQKLIAGMEAHGLAGEYAERLFKQICGFGEYGFPESHAASFAKLVYISAWLKHHYPEAFAAALVNSQPMGFYAPAQLVRNAAEHGVSIRPVDVNHSEWNCTLEPCTGDAESPTFPRRSAQIAVRPFAVRLGLCLVHGLPEKHAERIPEARAAGPFRALEEVARRARLSQTHLARLAAADAFGSLELDRRKALWQALGEDSREELPLFASQQHGEVAPELPPLGAYEEVLHDYRNTGISLRNHPLAFWRESLQARGILPCGQLAKEAANRWVRVAGIVLVRQRPSTASGIIFITLEDETGVANLIVKPDVWDRYRRATRNATALVAYGRLQKAFEVIHVLVSKLENVAELTSRMRSQSRDFQ